MTLVWGLRIEEEVFLQRILLPRNIKNLRKHDTRGGFFVLFRLVAYRLAAGATRLNGLEEVVAFVVNEDESWEIFYLNFPNSFHAEFGIFHALDTLDAAQRKDGCRAADGTEVEAAVLLAGIGDLLRAVALGNHYHRTTMALEQIDVRVHATGCGRPHRTAGKPLRSLGRTGVEHRMFFEIFW